MGDEHQLGNWGPYIDPRPVVDETPRRGWVKSGLKSLVIHIIFVFFIWDFGSGGTGLETPGLKTYDVVLASPEMLDRADRDETPPPDEPGPSLTETLRAPDLDRPEPDRTGPAELVDLSPPKRTAPPVRRFVRPPPEPDLPRLKPTESEKGVKLRSLPPPWFMDLAVEMEFPEPDRPAEKTRPEENPADIPSWTPKTAAADLTPSPPPDHLRQGMAMMGSIPDEEPFPWSPPTTPRLQAAAPRPEQDEPDEPEEEEEPASEASSEPRRMESLKKKPTAVAGAEPRARLEERVKPKWGDRPSDLPAATALRPLLRRSPEGGRGREEPKLEFRGLGRGVPDSPPVLIRRVEPDYPESAARRGLEGEVRVAFEVNRQGRVEKPRVIEARPRGVFEDAALEALEKWTFRPAADNGRAIEAWAVTTIEFRLN